MSTKKNNLLGGTLLAVVCATTGYLLGRIQEAPDDTATESVETTAASDATPPLTATEAVIAETAEPDPSPLDHANSPRTVAGIVTRCKDNFAVEDYATRRYHNEVVFDAMTAEQAPEVFAALLELPPGPITNQLGLFFFVRWGQVNGLAAVDAARHLDDRRRGSYTAMAVNGWASYDPEGALSAARELADGWPAFASRVGGVFTELAKRDLSTTVALQQEFPSNSPLNYAFKSSVIGFALEEGRLNEVLNSVMRFESAEEQKGWLQRVFSSWARVDDAAPLAALERIADPALAEQAIRGFLNGWSNADPEGALDYMLANRDDPTTSDALPNVLRRVLHSGDRAIAVDVIDRVAETGDIDTLAPSMLSSLSAQPELALKLVGMLSDEQQRERYTGMAVGVWARSDYKSAAAYYEQLSSDTEKLWAISSLAHPTLSREDGGERISAWMKDLPPGKDRTQAVERLLAAADSPYVTPTASARAALKQLAEQTSDLSDDARAKMNKLFGE